MTANPNPLIITGSTPGYNFVLEQLSESAMEPLTLDQMKKHLRGYDDVTAEDDEITGLIATAREWAEDLTGRVLIDQTWRLTVTDYALGDLRLHRSPVIELLAFVAVDDTGAETAVDPATYLIVGLESRWPTVRPVGSFGTGMFKITYRAGFVDLLGSPTEDVSLIPNKFNQAMKLYAEALYDRDKSMMETTIKVAEGLLFGEICELGLA